MTERAAGRGWAPGKLILLGEHAVVYGHRAIAVGVDRGTLAEAVSRPGPSGLDASEVVPLSGDPVPFPADPRLGPALATVLPKDGVGLRLRSTLPIGRGMGSSASLAIATLRALADLEGRTPGADELIAKGFRIEQVFHGTPLGLDHTVATRGGALAYRRAPSGLEVEPLSLSHLPLVVLDSGEPGDTAALVAGVRARRPAVDPALERIGALVESVLSPGDFALDNLGPAMDEDHALLREIGVSTPALDELCALARGAGARGAKLAGAGGGGVVIALAPEPEPLLRAAASRGIPAFVAAISPPLP